MCLNIDISNALKLNKQLDVIYTDFAKAFDSINFEILLFKLFKIGFSKSLINFLRTYITQRSLYVKYNYAFSDCFFGTSGVPQGSVLGPLLFILFVNDLSDIFVSCLLFADDLKIYRCISNEQDCEILQIELENLYEWCTKNRLYLNIDKCFIVSFTRKLNPLIRNYSIDKKPLIRKNSIKDLGIIYDSDFSFNLHILQISKNAHKKLGLLKRTTMQFYNVSVLICLFNTLIRSMLEYNCVIWNPSTNNLKYAIEKIQNRFLRYIHYKSNNIEYPSNALARQNFNLCSLECNRTISLFKFFYNLFNNKIDCPVLLQEFNFHVPIYNSRTKFVFSVPLFTKNYLKHQPMVEFINFLNTLPDCDLFFHKFSFFKSIIISKYA